MFVLRMIPVLAAAVLLNGCATTPKIHLKAGAMTMELTKPASYVFSSIYSRDGRYALSGSLDNKVTIWDLDSGSQARIIETEAGEAPGISALAMSPDGNYLITGARGGGTVKLWNTGTWQQVSSLPGHSLTEVMEALAFSADSKHVVAGGSYQIRQWDVRTGRELGVITHAAFFDRNQPYAIAFSPDSRLAFAKGVGFASLWDIEAERRLWIRGGATGGERGGRMTFNSSASFAPSGKHILSGEGENLVLRDAASGRVTRTFVDDAPAPIDAVAFSADGAYALSGAADGGIRLWNVQTGEKLRSFTGHSDEVASVAFSRDGRYVLSGGDASTRLWDVASGEELATMVSFADGEWLIITPSGYYNASDKGDQYLSVTVGGKPYTIAQLREAFYRPDLVKVALAGQQVEGMKRMADIKPPPSVAIINTPASVTSDQVSVSLEVKDQGGGIGDVRLYLNGTAVMLDQSGRALALRADAPNAARTFTYSLQLVSGRNSLRAIAFNADNSMQSSDALFEIDAKTAVKKPDLHALVVGIQEYENPKLTLTYPVADAILFADTLRERAAGLFDAVTITRLTTREQTTSASISAALKKMRTRVGPNDLFVFYVASHGTVDDGEYFLITSNVGATSTEKLRRDALSQNNLKELLSNIPAAKKLIVLDTCNAGKLGDAIQMAMLTRGMSEDTAFKVLSRAVGSTILSAANSQQEALEGYRDHGLFTYVLSEGLQGRADLDKDGFVKTTELASYIEDEVPDLAEKIFKRKQYPVASPSGQGFPVARAR